MSIPVRAPEFFGDRIIGWATKGEGAMHDSYIIDLVNDEAIRRMVDTRDFIMNLSIEGEDFDA